MAGLSGGGGESYTGDPDDIDDGGDESSDTSTETDAEPTTPAGPGLDPGAGGGSSGSSSSDSGSSSPDPDPEPEPEPTTPAGPGLDPGTGSGGSGSSSSPDPEPEPEPTTPAGPGPDPGGSSDRTTDTAGEETARQSNSRQSGGGDIADDGSAPDAGRGDVRDRGGRNPQRAPGGGPNQRQSGGGPLTDQGLGQADALNRQNRRQQEKAEQARQTAQNLRNIGADASVTDEQRVRIQPDRQSNRRRQREEFRAEAAEELGTPEENVDITFDESSNQFRAEQDLSDDQLRIDQATGGRFEPAVDAGRSARETTADVVSGPGQRVAQAATLPGRIFGGAAVRGVEAGTGVDVTNVNTPDVSTEQAIGLGAAGVVTPEPTTSIGGGILAGGALVAAGASTLSQQSEVDVPENTQVTTELDVGENNADVTEIEPGSGEVTEIEPTSRFQQPEVDAPSGTTSNDVELIQTSPVQQQRGELVRDDPRQITEEDITDPFGEVEQDPPSTRERQRRDDLDVFERNFPTGEDSVVGRGTGEETVDAVNNAQQPTFEGADETTVPASGSTPGLRTGAGNRSGADSLAGPTGASENATDLFQTPAQTPLTQTAGAFEQGFPSPNARVTESVASPQAFGSPGFGNSRRPPRPTFGLSSDSNEQSSPTFDTGRDTYEFEFADPIVGRDSSSRDDDDLEALFGGGSGGGFGL